MGDAKEKHKNIRNKNTKTKCLAKKHHFLEPSIN
jgi:hypothetical protein